MQLLSKSIGGTPFRHRMMSSFVMKETGEVGMTEKPVPVPGPDDAIIRTTVALICPLDFRMVRGEFGPRMNLTLGHEAVGIVHEAGPNVRRVRPGDRVVAGAITPDWSDMASQASHPSQSGGLPGGWKFSNTKDGVFADYFHVNHADGNLARIPSSVSDEAAVYCSCTMPTGLMAVENGRLPLGGTVAVFGEGPVGLMATAGAALRGAGLIIGVEHTPRRQVLAREYGADVVVDYLDGDPVERIMELTGGAGVDLAVETVGSGASLQNCILSTVPGGTIYSAGQLADGGPLQAPSGDWGRAMMEKTITVGTLAGGRLRMERMLMLLERKRIDPTRMTTHTYGFEEIDLAFETEERRPDGLIKTLVSFP